MNRNRTLRSYEPRVLVVGGKEGRWSADGKTVDETLSTGVQSWAYAFNGDYVGCRDLTRRDLDHYDVVIVNLNRPLLPLVRLAGDRPASSKWVSLIEGSANEYFLPQCDLKALLDMSDLVDVINRHSLPLFRALTKSKVEYVGMPYPVDGVKQLVVPVETRRKRIFLCVDPSRRWNEYLAAREIGLPYYGYERSRRRPGALSLLTEFTRIRSWGRVENTNRARALYEELYDDQSLDMTMYTKDVRQFLMENGASYLWIHLDSRYTWARLVLDAAALCLPIITTSSTYHAGIFFPETTVAHAMDIERAIEIGKRLCSDRDFYEHVASYPANRMDFLRAEPMKRTLLGALDML